MEVLRFEEGETVEFTRPLLDLEGKPLGEFVTILTWLGKEGTTGKIQMGLTQHYSLFVDIKYRE